MTTAASRTLASSFDPRTNSLNAVRLVLATMVIIFHGWALTGSGDAPLLVDTDLGGWAVTSFFVLSGFLITRSRLRRGTADFFRDRFLRIYPAFFACLVITAFALAPLAAVLGGGTGWSTADAIRYLVRNAALYPPTLLQPGVGQTLESVPYPGVWNGALWTLFYEALCYVGIGLLYVIVPKTWFKRTCLVTLAGLGTCLVLVNVLSLAVPPSVGAFLAWTFAFMVGSACFSYADRIRASRFATLMSTLLLVICSYAGAPVLPMFLAVPLLRLGFSPRLSRVARKHDLSYGTYIYGFAIQQILVVFFLRFGLDVPLLLNTAIVIVLAWALALVSSVLIEEPALRLKAAPSRKASGVVAAATNRPRPELDPS